ncbi:hypothetical protein MUK42_00535 [Musa troglodytarum]|uniref:Uncharacterized protein n=1 Tax=Musa troglodytarum TaxID=320322 RepID=A0A9E7JU26_9LILI|nr:hypothetical protein MUK42_00535 [Musa troglodytarum]
MLLLRVQQSPTMLMLHALHSTMRLLVRKKFLWHFNEGVKAITVASCISKIT